MRVAFLILGFIILEAFYNMVGGRAVVYFSPLFVLQASAFIGMLLGPAYGLGWGALAGFLEEMYFVDANHAFGLTPLVYLWAGWLAGKFFYSRADVNSPAVGALVTMASWIFGVGLSFLLSLAYGRPLATMAADFTLAKVITPFIEILLAPFILWVFVRVLRPRSAFE